MSKFKVNYKEVVKYNKSFKEIVLKISENRKKEILKELNKFRSKEDKILNLCELGDNEYNKIIENEKKNYKEVKFLEV